jgi:hypothetical protein
MGRAYVSTVLDAEIDAVWAVLGDFHGLAGWIGRIRESVAEDGTGPGAVGSVRRLTLDPGRRQVRERLVGYDATAHRYSYEFADTIPYLVRSYRGTVHLLPVTEPGGTFLEWFGEFDCDAEQVDPMAAAFTRVYTEFVEDLRKHLG